MTLQVHECCDEILEYEKHWCLLRALNAGTPAMRAQKKSLLPQWPAESNDSYQARLDTATLFPAYRRTIGVMAGKPFSEPLTLSDDTPDKVKQWCDDIDLQGVNLQSFAAEMFEESSYGLCGILVDYPRAGPSASARTVGQVERSGARPYFVRVKHQQILGWRSRMEGGRMVLTQLRLSETHEEEDGLYGTRCIKQVRVLEPGRWEIWRPSTDNGEGWIKADEGTTTLSVIPFVPIYGRRKGFMHGEPWLLDLAFLNVKHWQSQSDQDTILHVARVPILAMIGADDESQLTVGASTAVKLPMDADMKFVEHTGAAIKAGQDSLNALEEQMIQTGAELLVKKPGDRSATESAGDQEGNKCDLQRMAEQMEDALDQALQLMAAYVRLPSGGNVSLFKDFGAASLSDASASMVLQMQQQGLISKPTALIEMKRRGVLAQEVDPEEEISRAEEEGPAPGDMVDSEGREAA